MYAALFGYTDTMPKANPIRDYKMSDIKQHMLDGGTVLICTHTKATAIKQKHIDQWQKVGKELLRESNGHYYMARGHRK